MHFENADIIPSLVMQIKGYPSGKNSKFNEVKKFYSKLVVNGELRYSCVNENEDLEPCYNELANSIINKIKSTMAVEVPTKLRRAFLYRIVVYGRQGSGKRTQALELARHFNLVYSKRSKIMNSFTLQ